MEEVNKEIVEVSVFKVMCVNVVVINYNYFDLLVVLAFRLGKTQKRKREEELQKP